MSAPAGRAPATGESARAGAWGLTVFLVSLGVLFAATLTGYFVIRMRAAAWPPAGLIRPVLGLTLSTLIILASSVTAQSALRAARDERWAAARRGLLLTFVLGIAFLANQVLNWATLLPAVREIGVRALSGPLVAGRPPADPTPRQFAFLFYTLTGLHAAHVLGGLAALAMTMRRAWVGLDSSAQPRRVRHAVVYWHFLAAVWLVLYLALLV